MAKQALAALRRGIKLAAEEHRRAGVPMVVMKDGRTTLIRP